jgi:hypothetical protein
MLLVLGNLTTASGYTDFVPWHHHRKLVSSNLTSVSNESTKHPNPAFRSPPSIASLRLLVWVRLQWVSHKHIMSHWPSQCVTAKEIHESSIVVDLQVFQWLYGRVPSDVGSLPKTWTFRVVRRLRDVCPVYYEGWVYVRVRGWRN